MLLIGDIHITTRMSDSIITMLSDFVAKNPQEKHIVLMGDYVYHFAYDRTALFALYEFFVSLFEQGKSVYVLAGNHDRLGTSFVYAEAKKAFDLLNKHSTGKLFFITEPVVHIIEDENILFLPFMIHHTASQQTDGEHKRAKDTYPEIHTQIETLGHSNNKNEQFSAYINDIILQYIHQYPSLTIIHHYYTNAIQFPGHKTRFAFKDIALSQYLCDIPTIKLMSGHVHDPFIHKNYLCVGSVWSTSSLETNTIKGLYRYHAGSLAMDIQLLNPYRLFTQEIREELAIDKTIIQAQHIDQIYHSILGKYTKEYLQNGVYTVQLHELPLPPLERSHIQIVVDAADYSHLEHYVDENIMAQCKDIKLKKYNPAVQDLLQQFSSSNERAIETFNDRKQILKEYVHTKYPDEYGQYEEVLQELKIV